MPQARDAAEDAKYKRKLEDWKAKEHAEMLEAGMSIGSVGMNFQFLFQASMVGQTNCSD